MLALPCEEQIPLLTTYALAYNSCHTQYGTNYLREHREEPHQSMTQTAPRSLICISGQRTYKDRTVYQDLLLTLIHEAILMRVKSSVYSSKDTLSLRNRHLRTWLQLFAYSHLHENQPSIRNSLNS